MKTITVLLAVISIAECLSLGDIILGSKPSAKLQQILKDKPMKRTIEEKMNEILDLYEKRLMKLSNMVMDIEHENHQGLLSASETKNRANNIESITLENLDNVMEQTLEVLEGEIKQSSRLVVSKTVSLLRSLVHHLATGSNEVLSVKDALAEIIETLKTETGLINERFRSRIERLLQRYQRFENDKTVLEQVRNLINDMEFADFEPVLVMAKDVAEKNVNVPEGIVEFFDRFHRHLSEQMTDYLTRIRRITKKLMNNNVKTAREAIEAAEYEALMSANDYFNLLRSLAVRVADYHSGLAPKLLFGNENVVTVDGAMKALEQLELEMAMKAGGENFGKVKQMVALIGRRFNDQVTRTAALEAIDEIELSAAELMAEQMSGLHKTLRSIQDEEVFEDRLVEYLDKFEANAYQVLSHVFNTITEIIRHQIYQPVVLEDNGIEEYNF